MSIPKKLYFGAFTYDVTYPFNDFDDPMLTGLHSPYSQTIKIANKFRGSKRPIGQIHQTVLHESFHAIDHAYSQGEMYVVSHRGFEGLANGWYQVIADNKLYDIKSLKSIPKKVKIGGFYYTFSVDEFVNTDSIPNSVVDYECGHVRILGESSQQDPFSIEFLRSQFIYSITVLIDNIYCLYTYVRFHNECPTESKFQCFCSGVYDFLTRNPIGKMIKSGVEGGTKRGKKRRKI